MVHIHKNAFLKLYINFINNDSCKICNNQEDIINHIFSIINGNLTSKYFYI
jgi:hypothetical protein